MAWIFEFTGNRANLYSWPWGGLPSRAERMLLLHGRHDGPSRPECRRQQRSISYDQSAPTQNWGICWRSLSTDSHEALLSKSPMACATPDSQTDHFCKGFFSASKRFVGAGGQQVRTRPSGIGWARTLCKLVVLSLPQVARMPASEAFDRCARLGLPSENPRQRGSLIRISSFSTDHALETARNASKLAETWII